jgi:hypothetical protein
MANDALATYLTNHLAGSDAALELLEHLANSQADSPYAGLLVEIRTEVEEERQVLEALISDIGSSESFPRQATAWLTGKLSEVKLRLDDPDTGPLHALEGLEAVSLALAGKLALWEAMAATADQIPDLRSAGTDFAELIERSRTQRHKVEKARLRAARDAFMETG